MQLFPSLYIMNYVRLEYETTFNPTQSRLGLKCDLWATDVNLNTRFTSHMCGTFSALSLLGLITKWIKTGASMLLFLIHPYSTWHGIYIFFNKHVEKCTWLQLMRLRYLELQLSWLITNLAIRTPLRGPSILTPAAISAQTHSRPGQFLC